MSEKKKVIILSNSEICYNPRLAKAADSLCEQGYEVDVFNPIVGMANLRIYYNFIKNKKWNIREFDISKRNNKAKINRLVPDEKVKEPEFGNLLLVKDNFPKIVVLLGEYTVRNYKGILHLNLRDFLTNTK